MKKNITSGPGRVEQLVARLTEEPEVPRSILDLAHTFVDHEIFSMMFFLLPLI